MVPGPAGPGPTCGLRPVRSSSQLGLAVRVVPPPSPDFVVACTCRRLRPGPLPGPGSALPTGTAPQTARRLPTPRHISDVPSEMFLVVSGTFLSRKRPCVSARACARARTHTRLIFRPNGPGRLTRSDVGRPVQRLPSLDSRFPPDSLLILGSSQR